MNVFPASTKVRLQDVSVHYPQVHQIVVLRLDEIHPVISGNKWYKLRYYLAEAKEKKASTIVTMGGAWSNHIVATAAACQQMGFKSIGIIRGEEPTTKSTTLQEAVRFGMQLVFISRSQYDQNQLPSLIKEPGCYFIPAGGYGETGARGASTIVETISKNFTHIVCAVGTGTMLAGLANTCREQQLMGISALKGHPELEEQVSALCTSTAGKWSINRDFHCGGYGKYSAELIRFMNEWYEKTGIPSDFVYTGKLFYGSHTLLQNGYYPAGARVLVIHSGGLQGNASLPDPLLAY